MAECVLVSGGSGGIGSALCRQLAAAGYVPLVGYGAGEDAAEAVAAETNGIALPLDITSEAAIEDAVETVAALPHELAGIVLAASPPPAIAPLFRLPEQEMQRQWAVNVEGAHALLAAFVRRLLRPRKTGWIVGVLSGAMGGESAAAKSMGGYVIAKYGMLGLLKALEAEYPWLDVHTISPGYTETDMLKAFDERFLEGMRNAQDGGRFATPEEVAAEIMSLIRN